MEHQHTPKNPEPSNTGPFVGNTAPSDKAFQEAVAKGYEPHDLGLRMVFIFIGGLTVTLIVVLAFIYAVMMAMASYDRSRDAIASPVKVELPAPYAPLQPSLGFYDRHDQDHDVLDYEDMILMRERVTKVLDGEGTTLAGRHYVSIDTAMDTVVSQSLLASKPAIAPVVEPVQPAGVHEGVGNVKHEPDAPDVHSNDMHNVNGYAKE
jgi:hypothetical protein